LRCEGAKSAATQRAHRRCNIFTNVMAEVFQDVSNRVADFARRFEHVRVVAVEEHLAIASGEPIQRSSQPHGETIDRARQHGWVVDFDD